MIGFIGGGNMGRAMIGGILRKKLASPNDIIVSDIHPENLAEMREQYGISLTSDNREVAAKADVLVLSIKPQQYEAVIHEIRDIDRQGQVIVTIAPGKTLHWLKEMFAGSRKLVRCMPNTPALIGEGMIAICPNEMVSGDEKRTVAELLGSCGIVEEVDESQMDAVVAVSGSSPAYVFLLLEAMVDEAVRQGMEREQAYRFAAQAVKGSAALALETGADPADLKEMVCSPGGTTIEAVKVLEDGDMAGLVGRAMDACAKKSKSL